MVVINPLLYYILSCKATPYIFLFYQVSKSGMVLVIRSFYSRHILKL